MKKNETNNTAAMAPEPRSNPGSTLDRPGAIATFVYRRDVRLVDTDATGLVDLGSYIRMMEEAEYAFLRSRGLRVVLYDQKGTMGFPRLHANVAIDEPLRFDERVEVWLHLMSVDGKQVEYHFELFRNDESAPDVRRDAGDDHASRKSGSLVAQGEFRVAFCRFPENQWPYAMLIPEEVMLALTVSRPLEFSDDRLQQTAPTDQHFLSSPPLNRIKLTPWLT